MLVPGSEVGPACAGPCERSGGRRRGELRAGLRLLWAWGKRRSLGLSKPREGEGWRTSWAKGLGLEGEGQSRLGARGERELGHRAKTERARVFRFFFFF